jgi:thiosulfate/3-mercaptopyruvate sulfurtransferase
MHSTLISTRELAEHLDDPAWVVLDVRHDLAQPERWGEERYRDSHIPNARFVHLDRDLSAPKTGRNGRHPLPAPDACAELFSRLGIDAGTQVVAYDQDAGMFAARAWWMLRWLGHDAAAVLDGGFAKWTREGRPVTAAVPAARRGAFRIRHVGPILDVEAVVDNLRASAMTLIDARAPERFRGETEPLDPVAGHIPGALNRPYARNVNPDATFKPPEALRREFAELLGATPLDRVVHYCGSGVTSTHNALAMEVAGLPGTRLYPGSWSEWCADAARPVARGDEPIAAARSRT